MEKAPGNSEVAHLIIRKNGARFDLKMHSELEGRREHTNDSRPITKNRAIKIYPQYRSRNN